VSQSERGTTCVVVAERVKISAYSRTNIIDQYTQKLRNTCGGMFRTSKIGNRLMMKTAGESTIWNLLHKSEERSRPSSTFGGRNNPRKNRRR